MSDRFRIGMNDAIFDPAFSTRQVPATQGYIYTYTK